MTMPKAIMLLTACTTTAASRPPVRQTSSDIAAPKTK